MFSGGLNLNPTSPILDSVHFLLFSAAAAIALLISLEDNGQEARGLLQGKQ